MIALAEDLWQLSYPQARLGADLRRNVTVIRLQNGELVIHSTGPFTPEDVSAILALGHPGWVVEAMAQHDTFSKEGHQAFPAVPFLAPEGFSKQVGFATLPILPPPAGWSPELEVIKVDGVRLYEEHVFFHRPSRTLIVADLAFNFGSEEPLWTELLLRVAIGGQHAPGMSRPFKMAIHDEAAFQASMKGMLAWDFDRVIVGHGDVIETGGKAKLMAMLEHAGHGVGL